MRIRKVLNYLSIAPPLPPPPSDVFSSTAQSPPPWVQILQHSSPFMFSRINDPVIGAAEEENITEGRSDGSCSSVHGDRFRSSFLINTSTGSSISSSLFPHGRWCEEEKVFPLKKRRVSLEKITTQEGENQNKETKAVFSGNRIKSEQENEVNGEKGNARSIVMGLRCGRDRRIKGSSTICINQSKSRIRYQNDPTPSSPNASNIEKLADDDFHSGKKDVGVGKKRTKIRRMSSILNRTMPLLDNGNDSAVHV